MRKEINCDWFEVCFSLPTSNSDEAFVGVVEKDCVGLTCFSDREHDVDVDDDDDEEREDDSLVLNWMLISENFFICGFEFDVGSGVSFLIDMLCCDCSLFLNKIN